MVMVVWGYDFSIVTSQTLESSPLHYASLSVEFKKSTQNEQQWLVLHGRFEPLLLLTLFWHVILQEDEF